MKSIKKFILRIKFFFSRFRKYDHDKKENQFIYERYDD
jgi:hypothetical protein